MLKTCYSRHTPFMQAHRIAHVVSHSRKDKHHTLNTRGRSISTERINLINVERVERITQSISKSFIISFDVNCVGDGIFDVLKTISDFVLNALPVATGHARVLVCNTTSVAFVHIAIDTGTTLCVEIVFDQIVFSTSKRAFLASVNTHGSNVSIFQTVCKVLNARFLLSCDECSSGANNGDVVLKSCIKKLNFKDMILFRKAMNNGLSGVVGVCIPLVSILPDGGMVR